MIPNGESKLRSQKETFKIMAIHEKTNTEQEAHSKTVSDISCTRIVCKYCSNATCLVDQSYYKVESLIMLQSRKRKGIWTTRIGIIRHLNDTLEVSRFLNISKHDEQIVNNRPQREITPKGIN